MGDFFKGLTALAFWLAILAAWVQHVVTCIQDSNWWLLAFGVIVPPIGWLHGIGNWFGWF